MKTSLITSVTLAALAFATPSDHAAAQASTTRGLNVGIHFSGASLSIENQERNDAGGGGLTVGYGLNRSFSLFLQLDGARFDQQRGGRLEGDWTMGHVDLGVRYYFANSLRRWVPYLQGSLAYRAVTVSDPVVDATPRDEAEISGAGVTLGGGLDFYFTESFALDLQLLWTGGEFSTLRVENVSVSGFDVDATSGRLNLGVVWWP